jgi:hypothetical protein
MLSPARNSPRRWRRRIRGLIVNQFLCCQVDVFRTAVGLLVGCRAWKNFPRIPPPSKSTLPCEGFNLEMVDDIANARDISENVEENLMLGKFSHQRPPLAL